MGSTFKLPTGRSFRHCASVSGLKGRLNAAHIGRPARVSRQGGKTVLDARVIDLLDETAVDDAVGVFIRQRVFLEITAGDQYLNGGLNRVNQPLLGHLPGDVDAKPFLAILAQVDPGDAVDHLLDRIARQLEFRVNVFLKLIRIVRIELKRSEIRFEKQVRFLRILEREFAVDDQNVHDQPAGVFGSQNFRDAGIQTPWTHWVPTHRYGNFLFQKELEGFLPVLGLHPLIAAEVFQCGTLTFPP